MSERLGQGQHRRAEQVLLVEPGEPKFSSVRREALAEYRLQFGLVCDLSRERRVTLIGGKIGQAERSANVLQRVRLERAHQYDGAVARFEATA